MWDAKVPTCLSKECDCRTIYYHIIIIMIWCYLQVYSLAIIIGLFSCAWPQLKLIAMLIAWIVPSSFKYLSVHQRERLLIILDKYGKWSVIDFFTMLMM